MADNFSFTEGSGKTGAADDIGGVLYPRVKVAWGPDGTANDADTASGKALPVQLRDSDGTDVSLSGKLGSLTESAPASDTASSGINGRLQRIAQRLTTLIGTTLSVVLTAGTALIGKVSASAETSTIYNGTTALTPKFSTITASSSGATTIVSAVASKKIRVVALQVIANGAVNVKWQSHTTPTDKTGLAYLAANGGYVLPYNPVGWFETVSGEALDINLSGAVAVGGSLTYVEV